MRASKKYSRNYSRKYPLLANEVARRSGFGKPVPVGYFGLGLTNDCNCRCQMCDIWEIYKKEPGKRQKEIDASRWVHRFTQSRLIQEMPMGSVLSITGGEPFLRKDIVDIAPPIINQSPFSEVVIFTNGLLPERIGESCEIILQRLADEKYLSVQVSIDGIGEVHNKIRGMSSGFSRAVETIKLLQKLQQDYPRLKRIETGLVIQPDNVDTLDEVIAFRKEMNLPGGFMIQQTLPYFNSMHTDKHPTGFDQAQRRRLIEFSRTVKIPGVQKWLDNPSRRPLSCYAGFSAIYIDPYGDVYPCVSVSGNHEFVMGNIVKSGLDEIWGSEQAWEIRKKVKRCKYTACWSGCEIRQTMVQHELFQKIVTKLSLGYLDYFKLRGIK